MYVNSNFNILQFTLKHFCYNLQLIQYICSVTTLIQELITLVVFQSIIMFG